MSWLAPFSDFLSGLSFTEGLLIIMLCGGGAWIYRLQYQQISRLVEENRFYRETFVKMMNREFKFRSDDEGLISGGDDTS